MPELFIEPEDFGYIEAAVDKADWREIGGFGVVVQDDVGNPIVRHMRLLKQEISSGEVSFDDDAHIDYLEWLYTPEDQGGAGFNAESYGIYSWHSHGRMSTFYSSTDDDFIKRMGLTVPWIFSSIFNNKGEFKHRLDIFKDVEEICPVIDGSILYVGDTCKLTVLPILGTAPIRQNIKEVEDSYNEYFETLEKERDEVIKKLEKELEEVSKSLLGGAKDRMKADYDEFVTTAVYKSSGYNNGWPRNGSSSNGKPSDKDKEDKESEKKSDATGAGSESVHRHRSLVEHGGDGSENDRSVTLYKCYDMTTGAVIWYKIEDLLNDMDAILLEDIPEDVLAGLTEADQMILAVRDNRSFGSEGYGGCHF